MQDEHQPGMFGHMNEEEATRVVLPDKFGGEYQALRFSSGTEASFETYHKADDDAPAGMVMVLRLDDERIKRYPHPYAAHVMLMPKEPGQKQENITSDEDPIRGDSREEVLARGQMMLMELGYEV